MKIPKIKLDVKRLYRAARVFEAEKRPQILAGMGVAGFWGAMWWTYKNAPNVKSCISDIQMVNDDLKLDRKGLTPESEESAKAIKKEAIIDICKYSAGPVLLGVASSAAVIGSTSISSQRIAALSAVCTATQSTLDAYREKVKEGVLGDRGEQKDQKVMNEIAKDRLATSKNVEKIYETGNGDTLCLDRWTGRYFHSSPEAIKRAFNEISYQCQCDDYVTLNELYDRLNIPEIKMGEVLGWTTENRRKGIIDISFTATVNEHEQPVLVLQYEVEVLPYYREQARIGPND